MSSAGGRWIQKIPADSLVQIRHRGSAEPLLGTLIADPADINAFAILDSDGNDMNNVMISPSEVLEVEVVREGSAGAGVPLVLRTFLVQSREEVERTVECLAKEPTAALSILGRGEGRSLDAAWVLVALPNDLILIDLLAVPEALALLKAPFFENEAVEKVVFDVRLLADFLFHAHGTRLTNVYDLMIGGELEGGARPVTLAALLALLGIAEEAEVTEGLFQRPTRDPAVKKWCVWKVKHLLGLRAAQRKRLERDVRALTGLAIQEMESCSVGDALAVLSRPGLGVKVLAKVAGGR